jgi:hypothetical protein
MRGKYIIITVLAILCGVGVGSWRAAHEIGPRIQAATHLAAMAQLAAEERAEAAERAQSASEAAERFARAELALASNAREAADQALAKAVNRTAQTAAMLAGQVNTVKNAEGNPAGAERDLQMTNGALARTLAGQSTAGKTIESKLSDLDTTLRIMDEMIAAQTAVRLQAQAEFDSAKIQVSNLSSQLQQARAKAEAKGQALTGKRPAENKARQATSSRPQAERRSAPDGAQRQTGGVPARKPQPSWQQISAP